MALTIKRDFLGRKIRHANLKIQDIISMDMSDVLKLFNNNMYDCFQEIFNMSSIDNNAGLICSKKLFELIDLIPKNKITLIDKIGKYMLVADTNNTNEVQGRIKSFLFGHNVFKGFVLRNALLITLFNSADKLDAFQEKAARYQLNKYITNISSPTYDNDEFRIKEYIRDFYKGYMSRRTFNFRISTVIENLSTYSEFSDVVLYYRMSNEIGQSCSSDGDIT